MAYSVHTQTQLSPQRPAPLQAYNQPSFIPNYEQHNYSSPVNISTFHVAHQLQDYSSITTVEDIQSEIVYTPVQFDWNALDFVRTLNNGSFGSVSLFSDKRTGEQIAVKIMSKTHILNKHQVAHVANERAILASIDHPFTIKLYGTNQDLNHIYLAMRYECGGELFTYMGRYKKFPDAIAKFYAAELLLVIEYLHNNNLVHRDLKLENLLLGSDGHIRLADFGFAKKLDYHNMYRSYTFCGTPDYLAPEMIMMRGHGTAVDYWAFGVLIYEMLSGCTPFPNLEGSFLNQYERIRQGAYQFPTRDICHEARLLIHSLLQVDPTKRLGNLRGGAQDIKDHAWFKGVDWDLLAKKQHPGGVPIAVNPNINNFGKSKPITTPHRELTMEEQALFVGF